MGWLIFHALNHSPTHTCTHSHSHPHSQSQSHAPGHTLTYKLTNSRTPSETLAHTSTPIPACAHTHTNTPISTDTHLYILAHTHTHSLSFQSWENVGCLGEKNGRNIKYELRRFKFEILGTSMSNILPSATTLVNKISQLEQILLELRISVLPDSRWLPSSLTFAAKSTSTLQFLTQSLISLFEWVWKSGMTHTFWWY